LWPNNKYSLKVLWAKDQISSAYEKCQINDFKFDSSIFRIFTNFTTTVCLLSGSSVSCHPALEGCNRDKCGQRWLVNADHASGAHIPHPLDGSQTENVDHTHYQRLCNEYTTKPNTNIQQNVTVSVLC